MVSATVGRLVAAVVGVVGNHAETRRGAPEQECEQSIAEVTPECTVGGRTAFCPTTRKNRAEFWDFRKRDGAERGVVEAVCGWVLAEHFAAVDAQGKMGWCRA